MERLFTLDAQFLSYLLFNPVRDMLKKRQERVMDDLANAKTEREAAIAYKEEYDQKLKEVDKEAQEILSETRKKAMKMETKIIAEAKEAAAKTGGSLTPPARFFLQPACPLKKSPSRLFRRYFAPWNLLPQLFPYKERFLPGPWKAFLQVPLPSAPFQAHVPKLPPSF